MVLLGRFEEKDLLQRYLMGFYNFMDGTIASSCRIRSFYHPTLHEGIA